MKWYALIFSVMVGYGVTAERPNILFCMADDWGWPHAGAYGDEGVKTPNFDRIAEEGMLFHHVYTTSPSCTPSRNGVITGKYHWELGPGANLWSTLPVEHESFVHLLRDAGYVIGQSPSKTWGPGNIQEWAKEHGDPPAGPTYGGVEEFLKEARTNEDPFFFWLATSDPHRPYGAGSGERAGIDPAKVHLFEHYPDVPEVRADVADYYFEIQRWDTMVGEALAVLEERGLLENTIVIMTSDHGMPFPRGKGNLYDAGVRVPFAVRWGSAIQAGREAERFVSFADVAPTLLEVTGTAVPEVMTGSSFVPLLRGEEMPARDQVVFGRERHVPAQAAPDTGGYPSRAIRTSEYLYIRNYEPENWPAGVGEPGVETVRPGQWFADCDAGPTKDYIAKNRDKDDAHREAFALCFAQRPAEELYHLTEDPEQIDNVASNPEYGTVLAELAARMNEELESLNDPRAKDPAYTGFDGHPYFGSGGGMKGK